MSRKGLHFSFFIVCVCARTHMRVGVGGWVHNIGICSPLPPCRPQILHSGFQAYGKSLYPLGCLAGHSEQVLPLCWSHLWNGERNTAARIVITEVQVTVCGGSSRMVTKINLWVFRECLSHDRLWVNVHCCHYRTALQTAAYMRANPRLLLLFVCFVFIRSCFLMR